MDRENAKDDPRRFPVRGALNFAGFVEWHGEVQGFLVAKEDLGGFLVLGQDPATVVGALYSVKNGVKTELSPGSLIVPGGVAVDQDGSLLVTRVTCSARPAPSSV